MPKAMPRKEISRGAAKSERGAVSLAKPKTTPRREARAAGKRASVSQPAVTRPAAGQPSASRASISQPAASHSVARSTVKAAKAVKELHLIAVLRKIILDAKEVSLSIGNIIDRLKDEGLLFMIALISFPTAIPVPTPPGLTTLTGIPLCILTAQLIFRQDHPWIPHWISKRQVQLSSFSKVIDKAAPLLNRLTVLLKPRYEQFITPRMEKVIGVLSLLCSISIAMPILFGNAIPSAGIFIMSMGLLYKDGLAVLIGFLVGVVGIIVASSVVIGTIFFGSMAIQKFLPASLNFLS